MSERDELTATLNDDMTVETCSKGSRATRSNVGWIDIALPGLGCVTIRSQQTEDGEHCYALYLDGSSSEVIGDVDYMIFVRKEAGKLEIRTLDKG